MHCYFRTASSGWIETAIVLGVFQEQHKHALQISHSYVHQVVDGIQATTFVLTEMDEE